MSMLSDNIRKYRKEKGFSQEETAVRLHVVRQTVSKWENGISVPDAEVLIDMAELFDVPVSKLLGIEVEQNNTEDLTAELSRLNEELARKNRQENLEKKANEKRGLILFLSFVSMLAALAVDNDIASILLAGGCILVSVIILYRNLALLTSVTTEDMHSKGGLPEERLSSYILHSSELPSHQEAAPAAQYSADWCSWFPADILRKLPPACWRYSWLPQDRYW